MANTSFVYWARLDTQKQMNNSAHECLWPKDFEVQLVNKFEGIRCNVCAF